ncbi:MAG: hypothetical protein ABIK31_04520 [candidate division WOR-3 bacterium]
MANHRINIDDFVENVTCIAQKVWGSESYLPMRAVKEAFNKDMTVNTKVKAFKQLIEKYKSKQVNFEKSGELFSPYCIGYGNITSPIWFLGEAEGGQDSPEGNFYNKEVKTLNVLSEQHILNNVFVTPDELIKNFRIGKGRGGISCDYDNFIFASKVTLTALGFEWNDMTPVELAKIAGVHHFFTEYWRHRAPPKSLTTVVANGNNQWDIEREKFLLDLDNTLKPKAIIAYPPINKTFNDGQNTRQKVVNLFKNTNRLIDLTGRWEKETLINEIRTLEHDRPILLTKGPWGSQLTDEQIIDIGDAIRTILYKN